MKKLFLAALLLLATAFPAMAQVTAPAPYSTALTSIVTIKSSRGTVQWLSCFNPNSSPAYIQLFDAATATPGTSTPKLSFGIPATTTTSVPSTVQFLNAIKAAATTTRNGGTPVTTAAVCNFGFQ